jgi:hypothetical protein
MFRLRCVKSRRSIGLDPRMILSNTAQLMRQEFIDDSSLFVSLGGGIGC